MTSAPASHIGWITKIQYSRNGQWYIQDIWGLTFKSSQRRAKRVKRRRAEARD